MRRALEVIFAHFSKLLLLLMVPAILGLGVAYLLPRTYQSTATLWALQRYQIVGATGPEADLTSSPAETQATAVGELLQTRAFALTVANDSNLASTLDPATRANPSLRDDALVQDISLHVQTIAVGYNLFDITYTNSSPHMAQQVLQAVITAYSLQSSAFSATEGQRLLADYQDQLTTAKQNADATAQAAAQYLALHPQAVAQGDPEYQLLAGQAQQARTNYENLQASITGINQELTALGKGSQDLYLVIDSPTLPDRAVSRLKTLGFGGGIGLAVALLACALFVIVMMRRDQTIYSEDDLKVATNLPVLMLTTDIPGRVRTLAMAPAALNGAAVNGRRRQPSP